MRRYRDAGFRLPENRSRCAAGTDAASLVAVGKSLVALHDWTFILGPGFIVGIGNGLILSYLMYKSALVPRRLAVLGLVADPLVVASGAAVVLGAIEAGGISQTIATLPEFVWELSLGVWLIVKGFNPSAAILSEPDKTDLKESGEKSLARA